MSRRRGSLGLEGESGSATFGGMRRVRGSDMIQTVLQGGTGESFNHSAGLPPLAPSSARQAPEIDSGRQRNPRWNRTTGSCLHTQRRNVWSVPLAFLLRAGDSQSGPGRCFQG